MFELKTVQTVPLTMWEDGSIRITGSRVPLDTVLHEFKNGATAEQIQDNFPSLHLKEIYGAIAYYLANVESVEEYLKQQQVEAAETKQFIESKINTEELREKIFDNNQKRKAHLKIEPCALVKKFSCKSAAIIDLPDILSGC